MKPKHALLWTGQALLALFFAYAGVVKLTQSPAALDQMGWHWALDVPPGLIVFIGVAEMLGAIGIILPMALRILPRLSTWAAIGMVVLQLAAVGMHLARGEFSMLWLNVMITLLAGAVAIALLKKFGAAIRLSGLLPR